MAIASALAGFGVWSLVAQTIAVAAKGTVLYTLAGDWRPTRAVLAVRPDPVSPDSDSG